MDTTIIRFSRYTVIIPTSTCIQHDILVIRQRLTADVEGSGNEAARTRYAGSLIPDVSQHARIPVDITCRSSLHVRRFQRQRSNDVAIAAQDRFLETPLLRQQRRKQRRRSTLALALCDSAEYDSHSDQVSMRFNFSLLFCLVCEQLAMSSAMVIQTGQ